MKIYGEKFKSCIELNSDQRNIERNIEIDIASYRGGFWSKKY